MWNSFALRPSEVPVQPDAAEAQQWAEQELARDIYDQSPTLWDRFVAWILQTFADLFSGAGAGGSIVIVSLIALGLVAIVVVVVLYRGRVRRNARGAGGGRRSAAVFDDTRSAHELRRDAQEAAASGTWSLAYLDMFRAIVRSLDERVLLDDRPGMTAHEASDAGSLIFPDLTGGWRWAGNMFDAVAYGRHMATESDWEGISAFDRDVTASTPARSLAVSTS